MDFSTYLINKPSKPSPTNETNSHALNEYTEYCSHCTLLYANLLTSLLSAKKPKLRSEDFNLTSGFVNEARGNIVFLNAD